MVLRFIFERIMAIPKARRTASGTADPSLALMVWRHSIREAAAAVSAEGRLAAAGGGKAVREGRESSMMEGGCTRLRQSAVSLPQRLPARLA
jgi:hypothetical protein